MAKRIKCEEWFAKNKNLLAFWCMNGYTYQEIAEGIGINTKTLENWRKRNPEFNEFISDFKRVCDSKVANRLYQDAIDGNTTAQIFYLKNRMPEKWREKPQDIKEKKMMQLQLEKAELELNELRDAYNHSDSTLYRGIPADAIAKPFIEMHHDIARKGHLEYNLPGGRGSTKSSVVSLEVINLIEKHPNLHACICRMVGSTLRTSVVNQMLWAIDKLDLTPDYKLTVNPMEITKLSTGQKIYFRGADDPGKLKSFSVPFGHIGILWFEELDQFKGPEAVRRIEQSVIRGGDEAYIFKSFNPPKSKSNWANEYIQLPKDNRMVVWSDYTQVPPDWLGKPFIDEAEFLKEVNRDSYDNEYLGIANGSGGNVFGNVEAEEITDEFISTFDRPNIGVDWGYFPDPYAANKMQYFPAQDTLYIYDEITALKTKNPETGEMIKEKFSLDKSMRVICDSAEPKSIADYQSYDINAHGAKKGPGSVDYSMKWLAGVKKIVIDPVRCPDTLKEFIEYEFERASDGSFISGYPDKNNHHIDAVRYGLEPIWRNKVKLRTWNTGI